MKVAVWGTWHGRGITANANAIALNTAMNYQAKIILTHSQYARSNMEDAFLTGKEDDSILNFNDSGIDSLERLMSVGELNPTDFEDYALNIIPERLDLIVGSKKCNKALFEDSIEKTIPSILDCANKFYDIVITDVNSGVYDNVTEKVLKNADTIIVTLDQSEKVLEEFFNYHIEKFKDKDMILVLGRYDPKSKCSKKYVQSTFNFKDEVYCVPYLTSYMDAINNHNILSFFYGNIKSSNNDEIRYFFDELDLITNRITSSLNLTKCMLGKNNLVSMLKRLFKVS